MPTAFGATARSRSPQNATATGTDIPGYLLDAAERIVAGTARSMGIEVVDAK